MSVTERNRGGIRQQPGPRGRAARQRGERDRKRTTDEGATTHDGRLQSQQQQPVEELWDKDEDPVVTMVTTAVTEQIPGKRFIIIINNNNNNNNNYCNDNR